MFKQLKLSPLCTACQPNNRLGVLWQEFELSERLSQLSRLRPDEMPIFRAPAKTDLILSSQGDQRNSKKRDRRKLALPN